MNLQALTAWLQQRKPGLRLRVLHETGELAHVLPEVERLYGVPQTPLHHPEVDTGRHIELALDAAAELTDDVTVRFAVLVHDLGKALTPAEELPKHHQHEQRGIGPVAAVCDRLEVPQPWRRLALMVCEHHLLAHRLFEMRPAKLVRFFEAQGFIGDIDLREQFIAACEADARGRGGGLSQRPYPQADFFRALGDVLDDCGSAWPSQDRSSVGSRPPTPRWSHRPTLSQVQALQQVYKA